MSQSEGVLASHWTLRFLMPYIFSSRGGEGKVVGLLAPRQGG